MHRPDHAPLAAQVAGESGVPSRVQIADEHAVTDGEGGRVVDVTTRRRADAHEAGQPCGSVGVGALRYRRVRVFGETADTRLELLGAADAVLDQTRSMLCSQWA